MVVALTWALRPRLFVVSNDEEYARATGMRVTALNITLAVLPAVTVVVAMRVVGLLLIQCPDDRAERHRPAGRQQLPVSDPHSRGHRSDLQRGWRDDVVLRRHPSGGTIVLLAIALFLMAASHSALHDRIARRQHLEAEQHQHEHGANCGHPAIPHEHHVDYRHDGHRHAPHESHYDEHDLPKTHNDLVRH